MAVSFLEVLTDIHPPYLSVSTHILSALIWRYFKTFLGQGCAVGSEQVIIEYILKTFGSQFKEFDYELLESQKPPKERWIHNVDWARKKLVENGLLHKATDSPYGTWVLTEKGRTEALNL